MQKIDHIKNFSRVLIYADPELRINPESARLPDNVEEIEILLGGEVLYSGKDGKLQRFKRGTIFWHQGGEFDIWRNVSTDSLYRCATFTFEVDRYQRPVAEIGQWQHIEQLDDFISEVMELYLAPECDLELLGVWIYGTLLRQFIRIPESGQERLPKILSEALRHIYSVLPQNVSVADLAREVGCSTMQLNRLFMEKFQLTPGQYILQQRLKRSTQLLHSSLSIQRIAEECGFKTIVGFYKAFRKFYNMTPGEYRQQSAGKLLRHYRRINNVK